HTLGGLRLPGLPKSVTRDATRTPGARVRPQAAPGSRVVSGWRINGAIRRPRVRCAYPGYHSHSHATQGHEPVARVRPQAAPGVSRRVRMALQLGDPHTPGALRLPGLPKSLTRSAERSTVHRGRSPAAPGS